jgi:hypothetical protein
VKFLKYLKSEKNKKAFLAFLSNKPRMQGHSQQHLLVKIQLREDKTEQIQKISLVKQLFAGSITSLNYTI